MAGTATEITICGRTVRLGDNLKVRYTTGRTTKDGTIEGEVVELWDGSTGEIPQARLSCGWCFHDWDEIVESQ